MIVHVIICREDAAVIQGKIPMPESEGGALLKLEAAIPAPSAFMILQAGCKFLPVLST